MSRQAETPIRNAILISDSEHGHLVWHNPTSKAWVGKYVSLKNGRLILDFAQPIDAGLCIGSADIIGITSIVITPDMVGKTVGVFTAEEVKTSTGTETKEQKHFGAAVVASGGIYGVVLGPQDAIKLRANYIPR